MTRIKQPKPPTHPGDLFAATLAAPSEAPSSYSTTPPETAPATTSPSTSGSVDCTFCGKTQREVKNLVAGPRVGRLLIAICDECITLAASIVTEGSAPPEAAPDSTTTATTPEADALPQPDLRPLFPLLFATPSPRVTPIAEQCAARGEEVPVGQTAGVLRVLGYEVPLNVDDMARLVVSNDPKASIASTGRLTGYAWKRDAHAALMWFHDHPEVLPAISHESLAEHYTYLRRVLRTEWRAERAERAESEAMMIVTANVMLRIYTEARRRETALEVAARSESLASPVVTPLDPAEERIFEVLWAVRGRARLGLRIEPGDALTVTVAFERADVPEDIARLAARDADLSVAVRIERADLEAHEGLDVVMGRGGRHVREAVARVARYLASRAAPSASTH